MKLVIALQVIIIACSACTSAKQAENPYFCGNHGKEFKQKHKIKITTVQLLPRSDHSMFYLPTSTNGNSSLPQYIIFMTPDKLLTRLEKQIQEWNVYDDKILLEKLKYDLPLSTDIDLLKYSFNNSNLLSRPEFIAAAMLENGEASVINLFQSDDYKEVKTIDVAHVDSTGGESRDFCEHSGSSFFYVVDTIND